MSDETELEQRLADGAAPAVSPPTSVAPAGPPAPAFAPPARAEAPGSGAAPASGSVAPVGAHAERESRPAPAPSLTRSLATAAITTAVVTVVSRFAPDKYAATLVGLAFLAATWRLVLRYDESTIRAYGLSLGGLLEPVSIDARRVARDGARALLWTALLAALVFPLFWIGYRYYWAAHLHLPFAWRSPKSIVDDVAGQVLVIALPEEAFFRGYLQTSLDHVWPPRWRVLGADLGAGWLVSAAIFAVGHVLTTPQPARLAVFFPALVFGWLRARTGGVGAPLAFHAACNLFSGLLGRGYGLSP